MSESNLEQTPTPPKGVYLPPHVTTYTSAEILDQVGPALTGSMIPE